MAQLPRGKGRLLWNPHGKGDRQNGQADKLQESEVLSPEDPLSEGTGPLCGRSDPL